MTNNKEPKLFNQYIRFLASRDLGSPSDDAETVVRQVGFLLGSLAAAILAWNSSDTEVQSSVDKGSSAPKPPFNAEYLLHLLLNRNDREILIGDLIEEYGDVLRRFNKRRADMWFYKQVVGSLLPLLQRALLRIGALVWLGRILRRLIS